ncbi:MAG: tRNA-dihydrouridine synthase [Patescibacteria group bacterium]|nr:tRNA-dihydrouridine synthase [Patescibacteria group bacterium]MDE2437924.1 tRNA-dihydrouridine synthase [Patescibacteria group bacterium]
MKHTMIHHGFWKTLKKPIIALAPMADVTDEAFRSIIATYGKPDVMWTEFVSADGLISMGGKKLLPDLWFSEQERPIVAQFFTSKPDHMYRAAQIARALGFDGIDINMGCPDRKIEKQGAGAALIKNPACAQEIIKAAIAGAGKIPVSVKTRIGFNTEILEEWLPCLLAAHPAVITIHFRTRKEMSDVPANWSLAGHAISLRDIYSPHTRILGNGDIKTVDEAIEKSKRYNLDGVMIGRGIFGNPWLFSGLPEKKIGNSKNDTSLPSLDERLRILAEHTARFELLFHGIKNFNIMKKHYKAYVNGFHGAKELRAKLMDTHHAYEVETIITQYRTFLKTIEK